MLHLGRLLVVIRLIAALAWLWVPQFARGADDDAKFAKWEKEIAAFEAADQKQPSIL